MYRKLRGYACAREGFDRATIQATIQAEAVPRPVPTRGPRSPRSPRSPTEGDKDDKGTEYAEYAKGTKGTKGTKGSKGTKGTKGTSWTGALEEEGKVDRAGAVPSAVSVVSRARPRNSSSCI